MAHKHTDRQTDKEQRKTQYATYTIQDVQYTVKLIKTQTDSHIRVVSADHYYAYSRQTGNTFYSCDRITVSNDGKPNGDASNISVTLYFICIFSAVYFLNH